MAETLDELRGSLAGDVLVEGNPEYERARLYRLQDGEAWRPLSGGLPEPLPAMPYALVAGEDRLFAGLADGQLWESRDGGDSWTPMPLEGDALGALLALANAGA